MQTPEKLPVDIAEGAEKRRMCSAFHPPGPRQLSHASSADVVTGARPSAAASARAASVTAPPRSAGHGDA